MKWSCYLTAALFVASLSVQAQGIHFEDGNWESVRSKAQQQNRLIYVDVYTTWCGPCKILEKNIFPQKVAGDKYNSNFVNYRVDAEKGEGIDIAKKYGVHSYPTNLFIDPKTEKVVYRTSGTPLMVTGFTAYADLAIQERAAPMSWEMYEEAYAKGKRDSAFLTEFLQKAQRLNKDNDALVNDYVRLLKSRTVQDTDIVFLMKYIRTVDNDAIALLAPYKERINAWQKDVDKYFEEQCSRWTYATLNKAIDQKDTSLFSKMDFVMMNYSHDPDISNSYWYRTRYFEKLGDLPNRFIAAKKQGDFIMNLPDSYFVEANKKKLELRKISMRWSLINLEKVPEDKIEEKIRKNLDSRTYMRFQKTSDLANTLNNNAWKVYEDQSKDKTAIAEALKWSLYTTVLGKDLDEWSVYADTYAHLLFVSGKKSEAIALEQQAVDRAKKGAQPGLSDYENTLKKMQEGTL